MEEGRRTRRPVNGERPVKGCGDDKENRAEETDPGAVKGKHTISCLGGRRRWVVFGSPSSSKETEMVVGDGRVQVSISNSLA